MHTKIHAGAMKVLALTVLLVLALGLFAFAQAETTRTGYISNFRTLDGEPAPGVETRYKLTIRKAGQVTATLTNKETGAASTVHDAYYAGSQNILLTVPGNLIEKDHNYVLDVKLVYNGKTVGEASHSYSTVVPVARVEALSVTASFKPGEGESLRATFRLPDAANVNAVVKNSSGQTVAIVASNAPYPAGSHALTWNGAISASQLAASGSYRFEITCTNAGGTSPAVSAAFKIAGDTSKALFARVEGSIESLLLPRQPEDGEQVSFTVRTSAAGSYTIKIRDNTTGKSVKMTGNLQAGLNTLNVNGNAMGGHEYLMQMVYRVPGGATGKAQLTYTVKMDPPSISISAPASLEAGYGAAYPITYTTGTSGNVTLIVTDVKHTVAYSVIQINGQTKGTHTAYWNGLDGAGNALADGTYHIVAESVNGVGKASSNCVTLKYTGAIEAYGSPRAQGAITLFAPADTPKPVERTPVKFRVQTTCAGTLRISLRDIENNGKAFTVYNARVSAGMNTITIPGDYFYSAAYRLEATLTASKKVVGRAISFVDPYIVDPEIKNFSCNGKFTGELQSAVRFSFETASTGSLFVRIQDLKGNTVRTIVNGSTTPAGAHAYSWNGRNDAGDYVANGEYWIFTAYIDSYGNHSNHGTQKITYKAETLPKGVYDYVVVGKGDNRTPIYMYNVPNGTTIGTTYGMSAVFDILEEYGEWVRVKVSGSKGSPVECYVKADRLQKMAVTSPYRIEVNINRYGATPQTFFLYKDGKLIDQFKVSTGMSKGTTPTGVFSINTRRPYFTVLGGSGICYDTLYVIGGVCIHRIPMINGSYKTTEPLLGTVASHGCIRVPIDRSTWLYENIPDTTPVYIYSK